MPHNALYTDLSCYYDLMCADIDYKTQSDSAHRMHQIFGNGGKRHLDLACGTGPHIQYFCATNYDCSGLDINQPMLDIAQERCPQAQFSQGNMCAFHYENRFDLITCFLYSIHYSGVLKELAGCIESAHGALEKGGVFFFNVVDRRQINNDLFIQHSINHEDSCFTFRSAWHYVGNGEKQTLNLSINKVSNDSQQTWEDKHPMVALDFDELQDMLSPYFEVHIFEHDYGKIIPWQKQSGNAIFVCVKV
ncbi:dTDP-3-amino-3,4, 6-trideoxy-alpha-D-glucopyranose [Marinomonas spartinae]|uniref:dTDP-3-amino-3,4, 6-trideoxy-alpha-D-glucopyranose n=1 Tax=Marinomonas spartinae TaxID=1792290 RepID=A0A1A8TQQ7_9GAMM|nr:class I SAM-dependent methyltransferase [Marinomonas spartinae]SBS36738.1 dTDP-3-amino-3,4, 6-trideoxy-alpha-D-glucopyranose [Marinomonas spartinae]